jgi:hypothetical protein
MDQKRKGEIAFKLLWQIVRKRGIMLSPDNMHFEKIAGEIGVSVDELKQFARPLAEKLLNECFSRKKKGVAIPFC